MTLRKARKPAGPKKVKTAARAATKRRMPKMGRKR